MAAPDSTEWRRALQTCTGPIPGDGGGAPSVGAWRVNVARTNCAAGLRAEKAANCAGHCPDYSALWESADEPF